MKNIFLTLISVIVIPLGVAFAQGLQLQKKVDLDDVNIKGEAQGKGLSAIGKNKNNLDSRIKLRTSYVEEIQAEVPAGVGPEFVEDILNSSK